MVSFDIKHPYESGHLDFTKLIIDGVHMLVECETTFQNVFKHFFTSQDKKRGQGKWSNLVEMYYFLMQFCWQIQGCKEGTTLNILCSNVQ